MLEHNEFPKMLQSEINGLSELRNRLNTALENVPEGTLHVLQKPNRKAEFYLYEGQGRRKYIQRKDISKAAMLAQKEYNVKLLHEVEARLNAGKVLAEAYEKPLVDVYESMNEAKRQLITSYELSDEDYIKRWYEEHPGSMNSYPNTTDLYSNKNEHMRSKTEKIIADFLGKEGIPYVYEPRIILKNSRSMYPDFLVLNVRLRKTIIFEHFGLMSDADYAERACEKMNQLILNGYMPGVDFLFTTESENEALNLKVLEKLTKCLLK